MREWRKYNRNMKTTTATTLRKDLVSGGFCPHPDTSKHKLQHSSPPWSRGTASSTFKPLSPVLGCGLPGLGKSIILQANGFSLPVVLLQGNLQVEAVMNGTCNSFWMYYASSQGVNSIVNNQKMDKKYKTRYFIH